jgi:hypothetical protein
MPVNFAAAAQPVIFPKHAKNITRITYPQTVPVLSKPICVFNPDNVKYYESFFFFKKKKKKLDLPSLKAKIPMKKKAGIKYLQVAKTRY